jgi:hypothetical protein
VHNRINPSSVGSQYLAQYGDNSVMARGKLYLEALARIYRRVCFNGTTADGDIHNIPGKTPFVNRHFCVFFACVFYYYKKEACRYDYLAAAETAVGQLLDFPRMCQVQNRPLV